MQSEGIRSTILALGFTFLPIYSKEIEPPLSIELEPWWTPGTFSMLWRREKSLSSARNRTPVVQLVA
jgi:hypothetical protein